MSTNERKRRALCVEGLESRELLTGGFYGAPAAYSTFVRPLPRLIVGVVSGSVNFPTSTATGGTDSYNLSGRAAGVGVSFTGSDDYDSTQIGPKSFHDVYSNGSLTLTAAGGSTVAITYKGTGFSPVSGLGLFTATLHGRAVYTSGPHAGSVYAFTATLRGNLLSDTTGSVTMTFNLRR